MVYYFVLYGNGAQITQHTNHASSITGADTGFRKGGGGVRVTVKY